MRSPLSTLLPVLLLAGTAGAQCASRWIAAYGYDQTWRVDKNPRVMADVNGDGKADIVGFGSYVVEVSLSTGTSFSTPKVWAKEFVANTGWRVGVHPRLLVDMNKDGKADLVGFGSYSVDVAFSTGSSFQTPKTWSKEFGAAAGWTVGRDLRVLEDVNSDGVLDIIGVKDRKILVAYGRSSGSFEGSVQISGLPQSTLKVLGISTRPTFSFSKTGTPLSCPKKDLIVLTESSTGISVHWKAWNLYGSLWALDSITYDILPSSRGWDSSKHPVFLSDLDGDRDPEVIAFGDKNVMTFWQAREAVRFPGTHLYSLFYGWSSKLSLRDYGYADGWRIGVHPRLVGDVNGDGVRDIVGMGSSATVALLMGDHAFRTPFMACGAFGTSKGWSAERHPRMLADVDGDGHQDIVGFFSDGVYVSTHIVGRPYGPKCGPSVNLDVRFPESKLEFSFSTRSASIVGSHFLVIGLDKLQQPLPPAGCALLVRPDLVIPVMASTSGGPILVQSIENSIKVPVSYAQVVSLVPLASGQSGFETSNAVEVKL